MPEESQLVYAFPILECYREARKKITLPVQGDSMWPLIRPGDHVEIQLVDPEALGRGDILAFWNDGKLTVHRLIRKSRVDGSWQFCQRGDNQRGWSWVQADRVVGRAGVIHRGKRSLSMTAMPWRCLNRLLALTSLIWAGALATARRCRGAPSA